MQIGKRSLKDIFWILRQKEVFMAVLRTFRVFKSPMKVLLEEVLASKQQLRSVEVATPLGTVHCHLSQKVDLSTAIGVFAREDYKASRDIQVAVDIGANIGMASLYFLSRNPKSIVYAAEPVPANIQKLISNIRENALEDRFHLCDKAITPEDDVGPITFSVEDTGKYGGIGVETDRKIVVESLGINQYLEAILAKHGKIDVLKIDIEGLEDTVIKSIRKPLWKCIHNIYAENSNSTEVLPENFERTWRYNVEKLSQTFNHT